MEFQIMVILSHLTTCTSFEKIHPLFTDTLTQTHTQKKHAQNNTSSNYFYYICTTYTFLKTCTPL